MTPWVRALITANVMMFLLTVSMPGAFGALALVPALILVRPWTLLTYMFLHAGFGHILFNMLSLFFFGPRLEARLGGQRFISLYLVSGLTGAVLSSLLSPWAAVVGASGAVYGVMLGYARYWPNDTILIWGVLPVPARGLVIGMTVLNLWQGMGGPMLGGGAIANFAHLGGFLGAWAYLVWWERRSPAARFKARANAVARSGSFSDITRWSSIKPDGLHPINREELERLQRKIAAGEAAQLTPDERAFLNRLAEGQ
jgi:membrane associated rhomboid family serine protease